MEKIFKMGGSVEKQIQKALGSLPPCGNRCRFSESAICSSRVHPPSEIKSIFKFKTLRWRPLRWRLTLSDLSAVLFSYGRALWARKPWNMTKNVQRAPHNKKTTKTGGVQWRYGMAKGMDLRFFGALKCGHNRSF